MKNILKYNKKIMISLFLFVSVLSFSFLIPTKAADNMQYTMVSLLSTSDDGFYSIATIPIAEAGSFSDSLNDGYGIEGNQTSYRKRSTPIYNGSTKSKEDEEDTTWSSSGDQTENKKTYPNSWNGTSYDAQGILNTENRQPATEEEGAYGTKIATSINSELNDAIEFIHNGTAPSSELTDDPSDYLQWVSNFVTDVYTASSSDPSVEGSSVTGKSLPVGKVKEKNGTEKNVYNTYEIFPLNKKGSTDVNSKGETDEQAMKNYTPSVFLRAESYEEQQKQVVRIQVKNSQGSLIGEEYFTWRAKKGYEPGDTLYSSLLSTTASLMDTSMDDPKVEAAITGEDGDSLLGNMAPYYSWNNIVQMAEESSRKGLAKDYSQINLLNQGECEDTVNNISSLGYLSSLPGSSLVASQAKQTGGNSCMKPNAVYQRTYLHWYLSIIGAPNLAELVSPYGMFSNWFFTFVPYALYNIFLALVIFSWLIFAIFKVVGLIAAKGDNDANVSTMVAYNETFKDTLIGMFYWVIVVALIFFSLYVTDLIMQSFWLALNGDHVGDILGDNPLLEVSSYQLVNSFAGWKFVSTYSTALLLIFTIFVLNKFHIMLHVVFSPYTASSMAENSGENFIEGLVQILWATMIFPFLEFTFFMLLYMYATTGGGSVVMSLFLLGLMALGPMMMVNFIPGLRKYKLATFALMSGMASSAGAVASGTLNNVKQVAQTGANIGGSVTSGMAQSSLEKGSQALENIPTGSDSSAITAGNLQGGSEQMEAQQAMAKKHAQNATIATTAARLFNTAGSGSLPKAAETAFKSPLSDKQTKAKEELDNGISNVDAALESKPLGITNDGNIINGQVSEKGARDLMTDVQGNQHAIVQDKAISGMGIEQIQDANGTQYDKITSRTSQMSQTIADSNGNNFSLNDYYNGSFSDEEGNIYTGSYNVGEDGVGRYNVLKNGVDTFEGRSDALERVKELSTTRMSSFNKRDQATTDKGDFINKDSVQVKGMPAYDSLSRTSSGEIEFTRYAKTSNIHGLTQGDGGNYSKQITVDNKNLGSSRIYEEDYLSGIETSSPQYSFKETQTKGEVLDLEEKERKAKEMDEFLSFD